MPGSAFFYSTASFSPQTIRNDQSIKLCDTPLKTNTPNEASLYTSIKGKK